MAVLVQTLQCADETSTGIRATADVDLEQDPEHFFSCFCFGLVFISWV